MPKELDVNDVAAALRESIGLLLRRLRQVPAEGELTLPESAALTRLHRGGPATSSALAKLEQISPQSMERPSPRWKRMAWSDGIPTRTTGGGWSCRSRALGGDSCTTSATRGPNA